MDASTEFICTFCISTVLPFNHIPDHTDFLNVILNFFGDFPIFNKHNLNSAHLNILNNCDLLDDKDFSPDYNLYSTYDIDSKYYLPEEIGSLPQFQQMPAKHLTILHLNARSLLNKIEHIVTLTHIINVDIDVIAISETWENKLNSELLSIPGYNKCSKHRPNDEKGGGVALFVNETLDYSVLKFESKTFESVFIELKAQNNGRTIIGAIYRPPGGNFIKFNEEYDSMLTKLIGKKNKNIVIAGDFNINLLNHSHHSETENFLNIMYAHKMLPAIKRPTRFGEFCATLIDNIFTNFINDSNVSGIVLDDISDHLPVFLRISTHTVKKKYITKTSRCITDTSVADLINKLNGVEWPALDNKDPDEAYDTFHNTFVNIYNEALPIQIKRYKVQSNNYKPWITNCILTSIKKSKNYTKNVCVQIHHWIKIST